MPSTARFSKLALELLIAIASLHRLVTKHGGNK